MKGRVGAYQLIGFIQKLLLLAVTFVLPYSVFATTGLTFHGRILKSNNQPLEANSVFFHIQIRSPNSDNCLLYDEQQTLNMNGSSGIFVLTIGEGTRASAAVDGGHSISRLFANRGTLTGVTCNFGNSYTPGTADGRKLQVQFNDGSGWQTLPPQSINYVPLAIESVQVGGYGKDQLLRVADGVTATEFSSANWTELWNLITGTSTLYSRADGSNFAPTAAVDFNGQVATNLAAPVANTDATTKQYVDGRVGGKTADVTGVSSLTGDGKVLVWNQAQNKWEAGVPNDSTKLALTGGTMTGSFSMGAFTIWNIGHVMIADQGTLYLGKFTNAQESALIATPLNNASDRGRAWFNTDLGKMRFWNGTAAVTIGAITSSDVTTALGYTPVNRAGDTMSGALAMGANKISGLGDPTLAQDAVTKVYADSRLLGLTLAAPAAGQAGQSVRWNSAGNAWEYFTPFTAADLTNANIVSALGYTPQSALGYTPVNRAGDTMTGLLILSGDPSSAVGAATKQYVDAVSTAASGAYVRIDGTTSLTADWDLNGLTVGGTRKIAGLADPTVSDGAATKGYVDTRETAIRAYADSVAATAETDANLYTDAEIAALDTSLQTYADAKAATAESNAKTYADGKLVSKNLAVPAAGQNGQSIRWNNGTNAWEYFNPSAGTVNSVSAVAGETVAGGTASDPSIGLANTAVTGGSYGSATAVPTFTVDAKGRLTAAGNTSIAIPASQITQSAATSGQVLKWNGSSWAPAADTDTDTDVAGNTTFITKNLPAAPAVAQSGQSIRWNNGSNAWEYFTPAAGTVNSVTGTASQIANTGTAADPVLALVDTAVTAASYGSATGVSTFTVDSKGRLTAAGTTAIALPPSQITQAAATSGQVLKWNGTAWAPAADIDTDTDTDVAGNTTFITKNLPAAPTVTQDGQSIRWNNTSNAWEYFSAGAGSGDITDVVAGTGLSGGAAAGSATLNLANTAVTAASYGSAIAVPTFTVDAQGRLTAASNTNIALPLSQITQSAATSGQVIKWNGSAWAPAADTDTGITSETDPTVAAYAKNAPAAQFTTPSGILTLADTAVTIGSYGTATAVPTFTVDQKGRLTAAGSTSIALPASQITQSAATSGQVLKWNGSAWAPAADTDTDTDVAGATTFITKNLPAAPTVTQNNQSIRWNNTSNAWEYFTPAAGSVNSVAAGTGGISVTGAASDPVINLANTAVTAASYGSATGVSTFTVNAQGRLTAAGTTAIAIPLAQITQSAATSGQVIKWNGSAWAPAADSDVSGADKVAKAGDTMSGILAMGGNRITGLGEPTSAQDAATRNYADTKVASKTIAAPALAQDGQSIRWNNTSGAWEYFTAGAGSGDITDVVAGTGLSGGAAAGSATLNLANTAVTAASYGSATAVPSFTVDAQGRLTAASNANIALPLSQITQSAATSGQVIKWNGSAWAPAADTDTGITSETDPTVAAFSKNAPAAQFTTPSGVLTLANTAVTAASYGSAIAVPTFTVDAQGRLTAASNTNIALPPSQITQAAATSGQVLKWNGSAWAPAADTDTDVAGATTFITKNLPAVPAVGQNGQSIRWNNGTNAWEYFIPAAGTVNSVSGTASQIVNTGTAADPVLALVNTAVTAASYGSATGVSTFTVDSKGRLTAAGTTAIAIPASQITQSAATSGQVLKWDGSAWAPAADTDTTLDSTKVAKAGDTMTGSLTLSGDPSSALHATTKQYSDAKLVSKNLAVPAVGQDGQSIRWNNTANAWEYFTAGAGSGDITDVVAGTGLSGGAAAGSATLNLANTTVTAASYGSATAVPSFTVDAQGRLTAASNTNIALPPSQITQAAATSGQVLKWNGSAWAPAADTDTDTDVAGATTFITKNLPAAPTVTQNAQSIRWNNGTNAWEYFTPSTGTVTSVSNVANETSLGGTAAAPTIGLANTTVTAASYGSATGVSTFTVDAKGRLTAAGTTAIAIPVSQLTQSAATSGQVIKWNGSAWAPAADTDTGITSETDPTVAAFSKNTPAAQFTTPSGVLTLANTAVTAASYGSATAVPTFTVDAQGRLTAASNTNIALPPSQITQAAATSGQVLKWNGSAWAPAADTDTDTDVAGATTFITKNLPAAPVLAQNGQSIRWNNTSNAWEYFTAGSGNGNALTSNPLSQFAATTSAQLLGVLSDETGSGAAVFAASPTLSGTVTVNGSLTTANDVASALTLGRADNVNEGAQINWNAPAAYQAWSQDLFQNDMRFFSSSATNAQVQIFNAGTGANGLYVEGNLGVGTAAAQMKAELRNDSSGATSDLLLLTNNTSNVASTGVAMHFAPNGAGTARTAAIKSVQAVSGNTADLRFFTANGDHSEKLRITHDGKVGVMSASPNSTLEVKGTFGIAGSSSGSVMFAAPAAAGSATYTWPAAAPGSNMVLQSDASGILSWVSQTAALGYTPVNKAGDTMTGRLGQSAAGFHAAQKDNIATRTDSGFFQSDTATTAEGWPATTNGWYHLMSSTHSNDANYYAMQFAGDFYNSNDIFYRATNGNGATGWNRVWTAGNLTNLSQLTNGPGYLTGITSGQVTTALGYTPISSVTSGMVTSALGFTPLGNTSVSGAGINYATAGGPQVLGAGGGASMLTFHRPGSFALNFGVDTNNELSVGGWSMGSVSHKLWHAGNLTNLNQLANGPGYITSAVSSLGYTPVNKAGDTMTGNLLINNGSPSVHLRDNDHRGAVIHQNANTFYILTADGVNGGGWTVNGASWPLSINTTNDDIALGGNVTITEGTLGVSGSATLSSALTVAGTTAANGGISVDGQMVIDDGGGWHRTYGDTGWFNGTHGGGWYMVDATWVRAYNSKNVYTPATMQADTAMNSAAFNYVSDRRYKENIVAIADPLEKVMRLRGVNFDWKKNGEHDVGFIAQEVEEVLPETVSTQKVVGGTGDYKAVKYGNIVAVVVEAVKAMYADFIERFNKVDERVAELEKENARLKANQEALEKRLQALENRQPASGNNLE